MPEPTDPGDAPPRSRAAWAEDGTAPLLLLGAAIGVAAVLLHVDYLPTLDGPHHLLLGHLENHYQDPGTGWMSWLDRGSPFTALGFHFVFSTLERFLAWRPAFQLTLTILALTWGAGYLALVRALHPRRAALGLLGFATSISWLVHMGFFSFAMSVALGFGTLAIAARPGPWTARRRALLAALLALQAIAHAFGAELTGLVLLLMALAGADGWRARLRELGLLALTGLPAMALAATAANDAGGPTSWLTLADRLTVLPRTFLPGPLWRAWPPLLLGLAGVALTAARRRAASRAEIALAGAAALHLALAFTAPIDLAAWQLFAPRFLPFGCLLGAALLPLERLDARRRLAVTAGLAAFTAASLLWAGRTAASLRAGDDEALSGLDAPLRRRGPRLVVDVDAFAAQRDSLHNEIPYYAPLFNLGPLYAVAQGGVPAFAFLNNPRLHAFVMTEASRVSYPTLFDAAALADKAVQTNPGMRARVVTFLATVGAPFEDVVLRGRPEDGDVLTARGYVPDFRRGGLFIGHLEACPVTARIEVAGPFTSRVLVEYGADPLPHALRRTSLRDLSRASLSNVRLSPPLCGPMWLRVTLDRDGSGTPSKGDAHCDGADDQGRLRLDAQDRAGHTIACRLVP